MIDGGKMKQRMQRILFLLGMLGFLTLLPLQAQEKTIDEVVAVVGDEMILLSDIENQYLQQRLQGGIQGAHAIRCEILENLLFQKLLIDQAVLDSVEVSDSHVDAEMDRKLRYFIAQIGSREKLEAYYKKSIPEIKEEFRELIRDQMIVETMQSNITKDIKITPSEVKAYFRRIPQDSLPLINAEVEIGHIVKQPPISPEEKLRVRQQLLDLKERILKGERFAALAALYSEDPGSASKGGDIGFYSRGELFPPYEAAAFALKEGEISDVVESEAGYHIIQLVARRGEMIQTRHILIVPKVNPEDLAKARQDLDNVLALIRMDSLTFEKAASLHSDDPSKNSGGMLINPLTGTARFEMNQLDPSLFFIIDKMEAGQISDPVLMKTEKGGQAYRIVLLKVRTTPHRANLTEDYVKIQDWALQDKQTRALQSWMDKKMATTFIHINERYMDCGFRFTWTGKY